MLNIHIEIYKSKNSNVVRDVCCVLFLVCLYICVCECLLQINIAARCVSHKEKTFVVLHKVTVFFACGFREFSKSLTEMLVGWFGRRL